MSAARAVTLSDVARASGVSHQTVSRVVNGSPRVAPATRARVLQAVERLGYRPNPLARQLATGESRTVGIISFGTSYYGPAQMVASIERALKSQGYGFVFASIGSLALGDIRAALLEVQRHGVAGLILVTPLLSVQPAEIEALCGPLPFVMIDVRKGTAVPSVLIDQAHGSALTTRHLLELGHTRIGEVSGPLSWSGALERHEAWQATLRRAGLQPGPSLPGDWSAAGGYRAAQQLPQDLSAVVVGNDQMALGVIAALRESGRRVPEDVSVVGFDDVPEARFYHPPLSTVRQDFGGLGERSAELIVARLRDPQAPPSQLLLPPELVVRASTAAIKEPAKKR